MVNLLSRVLAQSQFTDDELLVGMRRIRTSRVNHDADADPNWYPWTEKAVCAFFLARHVLPKM